MKIKYKNRYIKCFDKNENLFVEYIMMCDVILPD